jgi:DNA-directed RNA polymerase specialized sigma24 family protein
MPKGKNSKTGGAEPPSAHDKIARLLGLLAVKDKTDAADKVVLLQGAGFLTAEIASMLNISENNVNVINFRHRNKKSRRKSTKK